MHRQIARQLMLGSFIAFATSGCDADAAAVAEENDTPAFAVLIGEQACNEAQSLELHATLVDCVSLPCTLPTPRQVFTSDPYACAGDSQDELTVAIDKKGIYHVELIATRDDGTIERSCHGTRGDARTLVDQATLDSRAIIMLESLGTPCPSAD